MGRVHKIASLALAVSAALAACLILCSGCGGHDDEYYANAALVITQYDTDNDGAPDTWQYRIRVWGDDEVGLAGGPPLVKLPDSTSLPTTCVDSGKKTVCETADQTPPGAGLKADVPVGSYRVEQGRSILNQFMVLAADLADPDPAAADPATFVPAPGALTDPAVLDWNTVTPGPAGSFWQFYIDNADGADDDGEYVSGRSTDWSSSDLNLDLPDTWDSADALVVTIEAVDRTVLADYVRITVIQAVQTGYSFN